jgi:hypothetical protein
MPDLWRTAQFQIPQRPASLSVSPEAQKSSTERGKTVGFTGTHLDTERRLTRRRGHTIFSYRFPGFGFPERKMSSNIPGFASIPGDPLEGITRHTHVVAGVQPAWNVARRWAG